jgi:hypothetical protein
VKGAEARRWHPHACRGLDNQRSDSSVVEIRTLKVYDLYSSNQGSLAASSRFLFQENRISISKERKKSLHKPKNEFHRNQSYSIAQFIRKTQYPHHPQNQEFSSMSLWGLRTRRLLPCVICFFSFFNECSWKHSDLTETQLLYLYVPESFSLSLFRNYFFPFSLSYIHVSVHTLTHILLPTLTEDKDVLAWQIHGASLFETRGGMNDGTYTCWVWRRQTACVFKILLKSR